MRIRLVTLALAIMGCASVTGCASITGCASVTGCASTPPPSAPRAPVQTAPPLEILPDVPRPDLPVKLTSADGRKITVTDVSRILPLTGAISEVVFTLGLGGNVVGRDIAATFPQAAHLPLVTRAHDVSVEGVLSLRPTVILADRDTGPPEAMEQLRGSGIPVVIVDPAWSLPEVTPRIKAIAKALGVPGAGERLAERTEAQVRAARAKAPTGAPRPRVAFLYLRGTAGIYLIGGKGSGADSMIEAAGGVDAGSAMGLTKAFTPITTEALIAARPDVILVMSKGLASVGGIDGLVKIQGIAQTPAGRHRRVIDVEDGSLLNFGPRTARVLETLVERLYAT
ncbi:iron complex transport system substrate-binding protein [Nonomuraea solani]|uniref:Iron complex transport system substrate-binding protein n=1 Tax=Nonomuraea solani TaxID=1144553 RepID=A0A1H6BSD4_9ACTN|nr:ABC transporter substrate-binding protein [Nonomuraea solani]SEG63614.1 iron complex transport system substrate-binding protein [Nonomuraea solani]